MAKTSKPGAKNAKGKYKNPTAAINSGKMEKKSGEIVSPGKVVAKVVAKVAGKAAAKSGAKSVVKAAEIMTKRSAKEKKIIAKLDKEAPKAKAKAQKMIDKEIKKNPNLFKNNLTKAEAKANARALKAAQGKSLASPVKKIEAKKNAKERLVAQNIAKANIKISKTNPKEAYAKSAKAADDMKARDIKFAKKLPNTYDTKTMKNVKLKKKAK
jgi:hypothetical protein